MKRIALALLLAACGGMEVDGSSYAAREAPEAWAGPGHAPGDAPAWTVAGGTVFCGNADWQARLTPVGIEGETMACDWRCVAHDGRNDMDVRITFRRLSATDWEIAGLAPTVSHPPCGE